jgi:hypothetical protein
MVIPLPGPTGSPVLLLITVGYDLEHTTAGEVLVNDVIWVVPSVHSV